MKRLVIAILMLVISIGIGVSSLIFVKKACNKAIQGLDGILQGAVTENKDEVNRLAVQVNKQWEKEKFLLNILIGQGETNEIKKTLDIILYFTQIRDYESVILFSEECKGDLMNIIVSNEPNLSTIL
ncbi:MAG: DUF4363 family protein [Clostridia bacterium]|nr:DUF4363 family protein [Clostridia bacterium]